MLFTVSLLRRSSNITTGQPSSSRYKNISLPQCMDDSAVAFTMFFTVICRGRDMIQIEDIFHWLCPSVASMEIRTMAARNASVDKSG